MKRLISARTLLVLLVVCVLMLTKTAVNAQDMQTGTDIQDTRGLNLELVQHTQNPYSKTVQLDLVIYPQFTSDRVQITWDVEGVGELVSEEKQTLAVRPGQVYIKSAVVQPKVRGALITVASVQAFEAEGTYVATASKTVGVFDGGDLSPATDNYGIAQLLYFTQVVATWLGIITAIGLSILITYERWQAWVHRYD